MPHLVARSFAIKGTLQVSATGSSGVSRTALECEIRWLGERHPDFYHSPWSQLEIAKVRELVENSKEGEVDWVEIATKLGVSLSVCRRRKWYN